MRKQVKLPPPKKARVSEKSEEKGGFFFFVKDQGEGAGKVAVIILKVLELILTTIFAVVLGIFAPLCIWNGDIVEAEVASDPSAGWWLASSIAYIIGMFALMLGHAKTAAIVHIIASVGTFVTYHYYTKLFEGYTSNGPTALYMPCLFITMLTIIVMLIINVPKWVRKRAERDSEQAPSILGDDRTER